MSRMESQLDSNFDIVQAQAFAMTLPMLSRIDAERLYDKADNRLRVLAYDTIESAYRPAYDAEAIAGQSFDEVYPEPPGLEAHRIRMAQIAQQRAASQINREQK